MTYIDMRRLIERMLNENYKDFVRALISVEKSIYSEELLDYLYDEFMDNDSMNLLNEEFENMIEEKETEKE